MNNIMKTIYSHLIVHPAAVAVMLAVNPVSVKADSTPAMEAREIYLHAPNNPTPTISVWLPKASGGEVSPAGTNGGRQSKVIYLPASSGPSQTGTVWIAPDKNAARQPGSDIRK